MLVEAVLFYLAPAVVARLVAELFALPAASFCIVDSLAAVTAFLSDDCMDSRPNL